MNTFAVIFFVAFAHFAVDCMLSIFPAYKTMIAMDLAIAGIIAGGCVFFAEATQLFFGKLIDLGHNKVILILGITATIAGSLFPYTQNAAMLTICLLAVYLGSSGFHPAAASIIGGLTGNQKSIAMALFVSAGMAGMCVGQLLFTQCIDWCNGNTWILGIVPLCAALLLIFTKTHVHPHVNKETLSLALFLDFFRFPYLRNLYFIQLTNQTLLWTTVFLLPNILQLRGYEDWIVYGGGHCFFILGATVAPIPVSYLATKIGVPKTLMALTISSTCLLAQFLFSDFTPVLTVLVLYGFFLGSVQPLVLSLGSDSIKSHRGMISVFLMGMVWIVSETIGLGVSGVIASSLGERGAEYALMLCGSLCGVFGIAYTRKLQKIAPEDVLFIKQVN